MRLILKILLAPVMLVLAFLIWLCTLTLHISAVLLNVLSVLLVLVSIFSFIDHDVKNGVIELVAAFLLSPYGLPMLGAWFGELRVVGKSRKRTRMGAYWTCLCSCGYTCEATASELVSGRKTNCGCKNVKNYASSDITGQRFGRLTAQYSTKKRDAKGFVIWHCHCDCGNETDVSYNNLMYCGQQSCGCKKREHDKALAGFLTHVDGTSIDAWKSNTIPKNNTTGVRGVYFIQGRYVAKLVFQKKQYFLGTYKTLAEAAEVRRKADALLGNELVRFYEKWSKKAAADPQWAKGNPIKFHVSKTENGELTVNLQPEMRTEPSEATQAI